MIPRHIENVSQATPGGRGHVDVRELPLTIQNYSGCTSGGGGRGAFLVQETSMITIKLVKFVATTCCNLRYHIHDLWDSRNNRYNTSYHGVHRVLYPTTQQILQGCKAARLQNTYRNDASLIRACAHAA